MKLTSPLTDKQLRAWAGKPPTKPADYQAGDGLVVRVQVTGSISFLFRYERDKKRRTITLGRYDPLLTLARAKAQCRDYTALLRLGRDPWEEAQAEKAKARETLQRKRKEEEQKAAEEARLASLGTVEQLFECYIKDLEMDDKRSTPQVRAIYKADIEPAIGAKRANEVTTDDVADIITTIAERGALTLANRTRSYLVAAFNLGLKAKQLPRWRRKAPAFGLTHNPAAQTEKALKREPRGQRHLSKDELKQVWNAVSSSYEVAGGRGAKRISSLDIFTQIALKLLLSTGQRVEEVLHAEWSEFDLDPESETGVVWVIPAARRKNAAKNTSSEPHLVPITELHVGLLDKLRPHSTGALLFPAKVKSAGAEIPRHYASLTQAVTRTCQRYNIARFSPRDIRRTWKTLAGAIGIDLEVRNRIQGHAMDDVGSRHYDRYDYLDEKRAAMEKWSVWLRSVLDGTTATVTPIATARTAKVAEA